MVNSYQNTGSNSQEIEQRLKAVFDQLEKSHPSKGWRPFESNDPIIEKSFTLAGWD